MLPCKTFPVLCAEDTDFCNKSVSVHNLFSFYAGGYFLLIEESQNDSAGAAEHC